MCENKTKFQTCLTSLKGWRSWHLKSENNVIRLGCCEYYERATPLGPGGTGPADTIIDSPTNISGKLKLNSIRYLI